MSKLSYSSRKKIFEKTGGRCWYCGIELTIDAMAGKYNHKIPPNNFTVDHYIPSNKGGDNGVDNLVPACSWCNLQKKDRDIDDFREYVTRLKNHIPKFTDEQLFYLKEQSISLPSVESYEFYFEKMELSR